MLPKVQLPKVQQEPKPLGFPTASRMCTSWKLQSGIRAGRESRQDMGSTTNVLPNTPSLRELLKFTFWSSLNYNFRNPLQNSSTMKLFCT